MTLLIPCEKWQQSSHTLSGLQKEKTLISIAAYLELFERKFSADKLLNKYLIKENIFAYIV